MANAHRGEIDAVLDGRPYTLCLTLGALAELESVFAAQDLGALAERLGSGRLSACDAITIITLGLKGGGHTLSRDEVAAMTIDGGAAGAVRAVSALLAATFGVNDEPA